MGLGWGAVPRAGFFVGGVGVAGRGLLKKEESVLIAEVGVICPEPWGVTESGSGGNRECEGAERVEQVSRAGDGVFLLCFEGLAPESGESGGRLSANGVCGSRGTPCGALVMGVSSGEVSRVWRSARRS